MRMLLNILTHGDERIGLKVAKEIQNLNIDKNTLTIQIANKKAFEYRKRFIDQDLNRSFPGRENGNYEERVAFKLLSIIKKADIVVDIHSTKSELKDTIIVTKFDRDTQSCIKAIQPKYVLVMDATKENALISKAKIGIAFEYGKDNDIDTLKRTITDMKRLLRYLNIINGKSLHKKVVTRYFKVSSIINKPKGYRLLKGIKNYILVHKGDVFATKGENYLMAQEDFYPILFSNNGYAEIFGFGGKEILHANK